MVESEVTSRAFGHRSNQRQVTVARPGTDIEHAVGGNDTVVASRTDCSVNKHSFTRPVETKRSLAANKQRVRTGREPCARDLAEVEVLNHGAGYRIDSHVVASTADAEHDMSV